MIILDNSQLVLSTILMEFGKTKTPSEDVIRHMVVNTYRHYRKTYKAKYGDLVICQEGGNYWRKEAFPFYKASRKKLQDKDKDHWEKVFDIFDRIKTEIEENFPYKNMRVDGCEADDIIAVLTKHYHAKEKILIVSSDKDFYQLHRYDNVKQYSPYHKKMVEESHPDRYLFEHIARGDSGDGVPNILSDDDTFVDESKRQKPLSAKNLTKWLTEKCVPTECQQNWERNQKLIDFTYIPVDRENMIIEEFEKPMGSRGKIFDYLVAHKMKLLLENINEF